MDKYYYGPERINCKTGNHYIIIIEWPIILAEFEGNRQLEAMGQHGIAKQVNLII
jgi:hypothetical protein